jgi:inner membrane protein
MSGMMIEPWILGILLVFSLAIVLITNWLTVGLRRPRLPSLISLCDVSGLISNLLWIVIIFAAGVIATRYIERTDNAPVGYLVFGLIAFLISWVRAILYRRAERQKEIWTRRDTNTKSWFDALVHNFTYVLFAAILYLTLALVLRRSADPVLFIAVCVGALLPDLDSPESLLGRLLPFVSRRLHARFGDLGGWHSLTTNAAITVITAPLIPITGVQAWYLLSLGFFSHLLLDLLTPQGIMLFWPATNTRFNVFHGFVGSGGSPAEHRLAAALAIVLALLVAVVDIERPSPPAAPALSYEQTLQRYYSMRGNNLVYASVEGSWQATGLRMSGWLEVLNAADESFIMLDRYDGKVFTAGRSAGDDLYLNRITLRTGPSVRVKPVEIHLQDQDLREGLPVIYEMQREPGLEHIFVSGDVIVSVLQSVISPTLQVDYSETGLRRIQSPQLGHYIFRYLTAAELIEVADLPVETADLVIVATYSSPATGPTVTPLPSPPSMPGPEP